MYTKDQLNDLYERIVKTIDISNEMFDTAEKEYKDLGDWIDNETPCYKIHIYSQGSFALGTVVKPIEDSENYDLDLVCEFAQQYGLSARTLKFEVVKPLLERYKKTKGEIENKRRCWHVEYADIPNFHMDIIPAINRGKYIDITNHDEESDIYDYIVSLPDGFDTVLAERGAGRVYCRIGCGSVRQGIGGVVFNLAAFAGSLLESESRAGGLGNGFPLCEAVLVHQATRGCSEKSEEHY